MVGFVLVDTIALDNEPMQRLSILEPRSNKVAMGAPNDPGDLLQTRTLLSWYFASCVVYPVVGSRPVGSLQQTRDLASCPFGTSRPRL